MTLTNLSDYANVTGLASGLKVANEFSGGVLGPLMVLGFGVVLFFVLLRASGPGTAFGVSGLVCGVMSVLFWAAGIMAGPVVIYFIIFAIGGLFFIKD